MSPDPLHDQDGAARVLGRIAAEAGQLLACIADRAEGHRAKSDGSPTTQADLESERLILGRLADAWPAIPVVSEECEHPPGCGRLFFLVDPLDGTRDYLSGHGEYSVNIALVSGERPIAAALAGPTAGRVWVAGRTAEVAPLGEAGAPFAWAPATARRQPGTGPVALVSRRHGDDETDGLLAELGVTSRVVASSALKFGLLASGEADVYVRCGPTMEWDTAAGDHILTASGGAVVGPVGPLTYGHRERGFRNGPFAAFADPALAARIRLPGK